MDKTGSVNENNIIHIAVIGIAILFSNQYFNNAHPAHKDFSYLTEAANVIKRDSQKDEVVFLNTKTKLSNPLQYLSFVSKRNILYANDSLDARKKLEKLNKSRAVFYQFNTIASAPVVCRFTIH